MATYNHLVYASRSDVYSNGDGDFKSVYTADCSIYDLIYHPRRDSYIVMCEDGIIELDSKFQPITTDIIDLNPYDMLPSGYSTMLYTTWEQDNYAYLSIHDVIKGHQVQTNFKIGPSASYMLLERPEHSEVLSLVSDDNLVVIDVWHAQQSIIKCNFPASQKTVYVNPNTYISATEKDLHVVDHRYGIVQKISIEYNVYKIWRANSQLFVEAAGMIFVTDV